MAFESPSSRASAISAAAHAYSLLDSYVYGFAIPATTTAMSTSSGST
jgi:hypothetical protein